MHDITEYQFIGHGRRVMVRRDKSGAAGASLADTASEYVDRLQLFLGATNLVISPEGVTANGAQVVRIMADLPDARLHTALLRFADGPLVELTLSGGREDSEAEAEFERLLASARPSQTTANESVNKSLSVDSKGSEGYPAGPLLLDLTPAYTAPPEFVLESPDGNERYTFVRESEVALESVRSGVTAPVLANNLGEAVGEDGRTVRYEIAQTRRYSRKSVIQPSALESIELLRGNALTAGLAASSEITGTVAGKRVKVLFQGPEASAEKAEQTIRSVNAAK